MRLYLRLSLVIVVGCDIVFCSEKKQDKNIITQKPKPVKRKATQSMSGYEQSIPVEWVGLMYHVNVSRQADSLLPLAGDGVGNKYYGNKIKLRIVRKDQSELYGRTFMKADLVSYVDELHCKNSALSGIVFDRVEGNNLIFVVSIGSPDKMNDEYVPLVMKISNLDAVSIQKDTLLDTGNTEGEESEVDTEDDNDGVQGRLSFGSFVLAHLFSISIPMTPRPVVFLHEGQVTALFGVTSLLTSFLSIR